MDTLITNSKLIAQIKACLELQWKTKPLSIYRAHSIYFRVMNRISL